MSKLPPMRFTPAENLFNMGEAIDYLYISQLEPFENHTFDVEHNKDMDELIESIRVNGIYTPLLVRPKGDDKYEIVAGHRRTYAAKRAGQLKVPCIIREMSDDDSIIAMVDTNFHRNKKPSEKAFSYKIKMEALKRKAGRPSKNNSSQVETNMRTDELVAEQAGESRASIQRYIRLTNLVPKLLKEVDDENIKLSPGVELSYLSVEAQENLLLAMETEKITKISNATAKKLRSSFDKGNYALTDFCEILNPSPLQKKTSATITLKIDVPQEYVEKINPEVLKALCDEYIKKLGAAEV